MSKRDPYMNGYMAMRREESPLQQYQDKKDSLKARLLNAKTRETRMTLADEFATAILELDAARRLYKTR